MSAIITILYPNAPDLQFDFDYYVKHHMPLLDRVWGKSGLKSWTATKYIPGVDGSASQHAFGCTLTWETHDAITAALTSPAAQEVMEDVAKFSNYGSIMLFGELLASSPAAAGRA